MATPAILDLRAAGAPITPHLGCLTWLGMNGHQHWKPGTPEWRAAFGADNRFQPKDRVKAIRIALTRVYEGQEFIVTGYHIINYDHPSSGRMVECYPADDKHQSYRLIMEADLELVPMPQERPRA